MNQRELRKLYNFCHIYGVIAWGQFPSWEKVKKAHKAGRVKATFHKRHGKVLAGSIRISGVKPQQCCIMFVLEDE